MQVSSVTRVVFTDDDGGEIELNDVDQFVLDTMLNVHRYEGQLRLLVPAIKYIRIVKNIGLKQAKDVCECYVTFKA